MKWNDYVVEHIDVGTWLIKDQIGSYLYLLEGREKCLLFDTGLGILPVRPVIERICSKPVVVINSHSHGDHVGCNYEFDNIYIHYADYESLVGEPYVPDSRTMALEVAETALGRKLTEMEKQGFMNEEERQKKQTVNKLQGKEIFELGNRQVEVIPCPGHTKGSIMLLDKSHRLLFTADSCCSTYGVLLMYPGATSVEEYYDALQKIWKRREDYDRLYPGHHIYPLEMKYLEDFISCCRNVIEGQAEYIVNEEYQGCIFVTYQNAKLALPESCIEKYQLQRGTV